MSLNFIWQALMFRGIISQNILVVPIIDEIWWKIAQFANSYIVNSENIGSAQALWAQSGGTIVNDATSNADLSMLNIAFAYFSATTKLIS